MRILWAAVCLCQESNPSVGDWSRVSVGVKRNKYGFGVICIELLLLELRLWMFSHIYPPKSQPSCLVSFKTPLPHRRACRIVACRIVAVS